MSCKSIIGKCLYKGAITEKEHAKLMRNLRKWIPLSKRYPDEEHPVLVCDKDGDIHIAYYESNEKYRYLGMEKRFYEPQELLTVHNVTAWAELPEPYEAERREECTQER